MPARIQRRRAKGWKMPDNCVYVGRGTIWGNPFKGEDAAEKYRMAVSTFPISQEVLREWKASGGNPAMLIALAGRVRPVLDKLRGKDLACWCPLVDKDGNKVDCHADVLLEIANS